MPGFQFPESALFTDSEFDTVLDASWRDKIEPPLLARIDKAEARAEEEKARAEEAETHAEAAFLEIQRLKEKSLETAWTLLQAGVEKTRVAELTELSLDEINAL